MRGAGYELRDAGCEVQGHNYLFILLLDARCWFLLVLSSSLITSRTQNPETPKPRNSQYATRNTQHASHYPQTLPLSNSQTLFTISNYNS